MRTGIAVSFLLLLLCSGTWTRAQAPGRATNEKTVRALDDQERAAVLKRDRTALERLLSDQFTVNAPSNQVVIGRHAVLDLVQQGIIHYSSFQRTIEFIRVSGDLGIVMGAETVHPIGKARLAGEPCSAASRISGGRRRGRGAWSRGTLM